MEKNLQIDAATLEKGSLEFIERLEFADTLFDGAPFRLGRDLKPSESMYDAVMVSLDKLWRQKEKILASKEKVIAAYWGALNSQEKIEEFSGRANTAKDIKSRIDKMSRLIRDAIADA